MDLITRITQQFDESIAAKQAATEELAGPISEAIEPDGECAHQWWQGAGLWQRWLGRRLPTLCG